MSKTQQVAPEGVASTATVAGKPANSLPTVSVEQAQAVIVDLTERNVKLEEKKKRLLEDIDQQIRQNEVSIEAHKQFLQG